MVLSAAGNMSNGAAAVGKCNATVDGPFYPPGSKSYPVYFLTAYTDGKQATTDRKNPVFNRYR